MENRNIVIILVAVVLVLAVAVGFSIFELNKADSKLAIAHKTINVGDGLVIALKDSNGNPISNETVHMKITGNDGKVINEDVTTNSNGRAKLTMNNDGKYSVECRFDGNGKCSSSSATGNVTVEKAATKEISDDKTSNYNSVSGLSDDGYSYYPQNGPNVDSMGQTREYAIANNMHYIPQTIDGVDAGVYVPYDSKAGCYHT